MSRKTLLMSLLGGAMVAFLPVPGLADDGSQGASCKAGWHMCSCKRGEERPRSQCETDELWKKCNTCWGEIAQFQCLKGTKKQVMEKAFEEARKTNKLVLYIGNTGG